MKRTGKTYIIQTNDGAGCENVFLTWDKDKGYFTTVDWIDEISEFDFHDTIESAVDRTRDANTSTFGGWNWAPFKIMELLNFDEACNENKDPDLVEVQTIMYN